MRTFTCGQELRAQQGRPAVLAEVRRGAGAATPQQLAEAAQALLAAGADGIVVPTDSAATPSGLAPHMQRLSS